MRNKPMGEAERLVRSGLRKQKRKWKPIKCGFDDCGALATHVACGGHGFPVCVECRCCKAAGVLN